mgnify:CR=1 FL=1
MKATAEILYGKLSSLVRNYLNTRKPGQNFVLHNFHRDRDNDTFFVCFTIIDRGSETIYGKFEAFITKKQGPVKETVYSERNIKITADSKISFLLSFKKKNDYFEVRVTKYFPSGDIKRNTKVGFETLESLWKNLMSLESKTFQKTKGQSFN